MNKNSLNTRSSETNALLGHVEHTVVGPEEHITKDPERQTPKKEKNKKRRGLGHRQTTTTRRSKDILRAVKSNLALSDIALGDLQHVLLGGELEHVFGNLDAHGGELVKVVAGDVHRPNLVEKTLNVA